MDCPPFVRVIERIPGGDSGDTIRIFALFLFGPNSQALGTQNE